MEGSQHGLQPQLAGWRRGSWKESCKAPHSSKCHDQCHFPSGFPPSAPADLVTGSPWGSPRCSARGGYELRVEEPSSALLGAHTPRPVPHQATLALVLNSALSQQACEDEQCREQKLELGKANSTGLTALQQQDDNTALTNRGLTRPKPWFSLKQLLLEGHYSSIRRDTTTKCSGATCLEESCWLGR